MHEQMDALRALALKHASPDWLTAYPRLAIHVGEICTGPLQGMYEPMVCFVLQGTKRVTVGDISLEYGCETYLMATVDVPATGQIIRASPEKPYISIAMRLDPATIAALLLDADLVPGDANGRGFAVNAINDDLLDPVHRLLRLLDTPADARVMAPMIEREIIFRLLQGPQGAMLRQIARSD
ncbi:MAG: AraC family transcriptional regulator, partial [Sphingomonas sanxanigenens]